MPITVVNHVGELREQLKLKPKEFALLFGASEDEVAAWECADDASPTMPRIITLFLGQHPERWVVTVLELRFEDARSRGAQEEITALAELQRKFHKHGFV